MKLAEETYGQARHMTITEGQGVNAEEHGHWYSPSAVAQFIADEREACATMVDHILREGGGTFGDAIRKRSNA
jgi:hypothetical protein